MPASLQTANDQKSTIQAICSASRHERSLERQISFRIMRQKSITTLATLAPNSRHLGPKPRPAAQTARILARKLDRARDDVLRLTAKPATTRNLSLLQSARNQARKLAAQLDKATAYEARATARLARLDDLRRQLETTRKRLRILRAQLARTRPAPQLPTPRSPGPTAQPCDPNHGERYRRTYKPQPLTPATLAALAPFFHVHNGQLIRTANGKPPRMPNIAHRGLPTVRAVDLLHALDPSTIQPEDLI